MRLPNEVANDKSRQTYGPNEVYRMREVGGDVVKNAAVEPSSSPDFK